jgi:hypothetical protein
MCRPLSWPQAEKKQLVAKGDYAMKKLMTALLGLAFLTGSVAVAADKPADKKIEKTAPKKDVVKKDVKKDVVKKDVVKKDDAKKDGKTESKQKSAPKTKSDSKDSEKK